MSHEQRCAETVQKRVFAEPPNYSITLELVVPTFEGSWDSGLGHRTHISGKFYSSSDDIEGLTLNYSIYNKTDSELIDSGQFTPGPSNIWHKQSGHCLNEDLRGKTIEFKFWNPNEDNEKSLRLHGTLYVSELVLDC